MTGRKFPALIVSAAAFVLLPALALAQAPTKAQQDAIRANCRSDYMKNCSSVTPGGREALECLQQNKAKTSSGCQGALNAISAPPAAAPPPAAAKPEPRPEPKMESKAEPAAPPPAAAAPHAPAAPKAPPPAAARPAAPKAATAPARPAAAPPAAASAAPPPAAAMPAPADAAPRPMGLGEAFVIRRFCANDFRVLCKGVQIGQGRAVKCLAENTPALSPGCKQAMAKAGY